jgi:hypothetical protein
MQNAAAAVRIPEQEVRARFRRMVTGIKQKHGLALVSSQAAAVRCRLDQIRLLTVPNQNGFIVDDGTKDDLLT